MHDQRRFIVAAGVLALLAGVSMTAVQAAEGATPTSSQAGPLHASAVRVATATPYGQPAHLVPTIGPRSSSSTPATFSTNWSGYVDTGPQFTGISSSWIVPSVQASAAPLASGTWIGIDGYSNSTLIQTGTAQETAGGVTSYYAWYELLPDESILLFSVSPGDEMQASIEQDTASTWTISVDDVTSAQAQSGVVFYSTPGTSAEWIEEAPETGSGQQTSLANFGTVQFANIGISDSNPSAVVENPIDMINSSQNVIAAPSPFSNNSFTIADDSQNVPTPTSTTASVNPTSTPQGGSVTYAASVTSAAGTPTGSITFADGSSTLCTSAPLVNGSGSCRATTAPVGSDTITATYSGDAGHASSEGVASLDVTGPTSPGGYWLVGSDGGIFTFGSAPFYGSTGNLHLQRPVVGITVTADRGGYWLVASDGGVFTFGDAGFFGSIPGMGIAPAGTPGGAKKLNAPIVGMVPSADGRGYFMVASDGGVFAFGDAKFEGSCPGIGGCSGAAVTVMPDASGNGYWLVTGTGSVYTFGDATSYGEPGPPSSPVTSAVRTVDGKGYWILFANGTVAAYGDAANRGGPGGLGGTDPATAIFTTGDTGGYWITSADGAVFSFGDALYDGDVAGKQLNGSIIAGAGF